MNSVEGGISEFEVIEKHYDMEEPQKFSEALMESKDDSFGAFYITNIEGSDKKIMIYIFEGSYEELMNLPKMIIESHLKKVKIKQIQQDIFISS